MKIVFATLAILGLTYAQTSLIFLVALCALNAITATGCAATDAKCVCSKPAFLSSVDACIQKACSASDIQKTYAFAQSYCAAAGITITTPGAAGASSAPASSAPASSAPASASASSTASASSAASSSSGAAQSASSAASSVASSAAASASSSSPAPYTGAGVPLVRGIELMVGALGLAAVAM